MKDNIFIISKPDIVSEELRKYIEDNIIYLKKIDSDITVLNLPNNTIFVKDSARQIKICIKKDRDILKDLYNVVDSMCTKPFELLYFKCDEGKVYDAELFTSGCIIKIDGSTNGLVKEDDIINITLNTYSYTGDKITERATILSKYINNK